MEPFCTCLERSIHSHITTDRNMTPCFWGCCFCNPIISECLGLKCAFKVGNFLDRNKEKISHQNHCLASRTKILLKELSLLKYSISSANSPWPEVNIPMRLGRIAPEKESAKTLSRWDRRPSWKVAAIRSNSYWACQGEKIVNQRWWYKNELKIELKSNSLFKWFANLDVKFGMNVVNDHSRESYVPADHWNIITH